MASACVNNFLDYTPDFEFRLQHPVTMLPADELFSDGKLLPHPLSINHSLPVTTPSPETLISHRKDDPYLFSPKAPRCSTTWKDLLGFKKLYSSNGGAGLNKTTLLYNSCSDNKSFKHLLHRKTTPFTPENAPLLKHHSDSEHDASLSSFRFSFSSSSSIHDAELPRLSLDSEKPNPNPISIHRNPNPNHQRIRLVKQKQAFSDNARESHRRCNRIGRSPNREPAKESGTVGCRGVSVDSPRINSSGKIVFHNLKRSSSSPSSLKNRDRGTERFNSAKVRVTPVLNVPVSSLTGSVFGFGQLFSSMQKKEPGVANTVVAKGVKKTARG
ncbi:hypothetical protein Lal_00018286 [Lupinus albus]|uniref:Uncharacterized protein n=1 Tax=Lupinus albus TaxID=3870 RepID=A0A6A4N4W0_LUPAL|nr:hypothetical protein Lalb_Chr25g0285141 [Lupinus albus]KAF1866900.1 hypothetical protein Lal_00018286 [Lupinus albus]